MLTWTSPTNEDVSRIDQRPIAKSAVLGFDELNAENWPGETDALNEVFGLDAFKIERSQRGSTPSYIIKE